MNKPVSMAGDGEFAPKGQGGARPLAPELPQPPAPAPAPVQLRPAPAPAATDLPDYILSPPRKVFRTQIGLRLDHDIYEELLALSQRQKVPMQRICNDAIAKFLREVAAGSGKGRR